MADQSEWLCADCRWALLTKLNAISAVRSPQGAVSAFRERVFQPWCTFGAVPIVLNPNSPIVECSEFKRREQPCVMHTRSEAGAAVDDHSQ